jgi:23S rRNA (cytosine1962-C5)-methyltransferase
MNESKITIKKRGAERIKNGHLWIYRSDLLQPKADGGSVVSVFDERKKFLGKAFYSNKSEIALRVLTVNDDKIDQNFWRRRIRNAAQRRDFNQKSKIKNQKSNAFRLIYSEGDLLSSLIVDVYDDVLVMQTMSQGTERLKQTFAEILQEEFQPRAIVERNDVKVRELEGLPLQTGVLLGECPAEIRIEQDSIKFYVSTLSGQKTGAFLDQRENRLALRKYAHGNALDCFTFNGGFALNLAQTCEKVAAIDISPEAVELAQRNAGLNEINNVSFQTGNVFDYLRELENSREKFDTIVLDPPAFAKNRASLSGAIRGYKEINLRALKLLKTNGILATCTCSYQMSEANFLKIIEEAALDAKRRVQLIEKRTQSSDHPILLGMPETYYLKCLILRVID